MAKTIGYLVIFFLFCCHAVGFLLFCKGFLLKRVVIPEYANCTNLHQSSQPLYNHNYQTEDIKNCYSFPRPYKRAIWLLVDALRYDFVLFNESLPEPVPVYRNKLPFIRDVLRDYPGNTRLFKFVADPPTTTMQRLKALTTGSLPTFIDVGSNFNSYAVSEDSLPRQFLQNGRNVTFVGDDTWLGLYPDMLTKVFDYPSLNVQDLDTVDDGVMRHLEPELALKDADLVIGHMLGVDHVGHTYGPSHSVIERKLIQVNNYIKQLITHSVEDDSILFIFGDHGMTPTGDHGGETSLETDAALIVYSKRPLFDPSEPSVGHEIDQVDIVPTTSLVLGLPIPFSNLGTLIPEVLLPYTGPEREGGMKNPVEGMKGDEDPVGHGNGGVSNGYSGRVTLHFLDALRANAEQLHNYLVTYAQYSDDFPADDFSSLEKDFSSVMGSYKELVRSQEGGSGTLPSQETLTEIAGKFIIYTKSVKKMCSQVWAKFDDFPIKQGLLLLVASVIVSTVMLLDVHEASHAVSLSIQVGGASGAILGVVLLYFLGVEVSILGCVASLLNFAFACLLSILAVFIIRFRATLFRNIYVFVNFVRSMLGLPGTIWRLNVLQILAVVLLSVHAAAMFSNSFILYEADMLAFFIQSMVAGLGIRELHSKFTRKFKAFRLSFKDMFATLAPYLVIMTCVRLSKAFYACRDLQIQDGCRSTSFIQGLTSVGDSLGVLASWRLVASCLAVTAVPMGFMLLLRWTDLRAVVSRRLAVMSEIALGLCVACVVVHWSLQSLSQSARVALPTWQHTAAPLVTYVVTAAIIITAVLRPFRKSLINNLPSGNSDGKEQVAERSSSMGAVTHRHPPSSESHFDSSGQRTRTKAVEHERLDEDVSEVVDVPVRPDAGTLVGVVIGVIVVALWVPLAMLLNDGIALSAFLTAVEMACVLYISRKTAQGGLLEVCVLWIFLSSHSFFSFGHHATVTSLRFEAAFVGIHGEITKYNLPLAALLVGLNTMASQILFGLGLPLLFLMRTSHKISILSDQILPLLLSYCVLHSWKLVTTAAAASMHRRHLMVWWVFAPRYLYEGSFQFVADVAVFLGLLLVRRLHGALPSSSPV